MSVFSRIALPAALLGGAILNGQAADPKAAAPKGGSMLLEPSLEDIQKALEEKIKKLEKEYAEVIKSKDTHALNEALHTAVEQNDIDAAKFLITKGADVKSVMKGEQFPLKIAVTSERSEKYKLEMAKMLIDAGADPNQRVQGVSVGERSTYSTTSQPVLNGARSAEMVRLLLKEGADPTVTDSGGKTALHSFCELREHSKIIEILSDGRCSSCVGKNDYSGSNPFEKFIATLEGTDNTENVKKIFDLFLSNGASLNAPDSEFNPLLKAIYLKKPEFTRMLLKYGADANIRITHPDPKTGSYTPLHQFAALKTPDLLFAKILIEEGKADINARTGDGLTPLDVAIDAGYLDKVEFFLARGAKLNMSRIAPILRRLSRDPSNQDLIKFIHDVDQGRVKPVDRSTQQEMEYTQPGIALNMRANPRNRQNSEDQIEAAPEPKYESVSRDPLYDAVWNNDLPATRKLLYEGADVQRRYKSGQDESISLLHVAAQTGSKELIHLLAEKGININTRDSRGLTPIMHAARDGNGEALTALAEKGADPNRYFEMASKADIGIENGKANAAHMAVESGDLATIKAAIQAGADLNARDAANRRPVDLALEHMKRGEMNQAVIAGAISASMKLEGSEKTSPTSPSPSPAKTVLPETQEIIR